jgi:hypothetical protein
LVRIKWKSKIYYCQNPKYTTVRIQNPIKLFICKANILTWPKEPLWDFVALICIRIEIRKYIVFLNNICVYI